MNSEEIIERNDRAMSTFRRLYAAADLPLEVVADMPIQDRPFRLRVWGVLLVIALALSVVQLRNVQAQRTTDYEYREHLRESQKGYERIAGLEQNQQSMEKRLDGVEPRIAALEKATAASLSTLEWQGRVLMGLGTLGVTLIGAMFLRAVLKSKG